MGDSGIFRPPTLQAWQRESILAAASFLRSRFGNPPGDPTARAVHDGLLEVLDPSRRSVRLQKELQEGRKAAAPPPAVVGQRKPRSGSDRRKTDRRRVNVGPPEGVSERRKGDRRSGRDRRNKA